MYHIFFSGNKPNIIKYNRAILIHIFIYSGNVQMKPGKISN